MSPHRIRIVVAFLALLAAPAFAADPWPAPAAADLARIKARTVCSCVFVQKMSFEQCADGRSAIWRYLSFVEQPPLLASSGERLDIAIDPSGALVRLLAGERLLAQSRFIDDGGGCVTLPTPGESELNAWMVAPARAPEARADSEPLPRGKLPENVDAALIDRALDKVTRAAVVIHQDQVVADRYANGYGRHNNFYTGSVSKVMTNLVAGLLARDGKLRVTDAINLPEWRAKGDARSRVTYQQLLQMVSGISWDEDFFTPQGPGFQVYFAGPASFDVVKYMTAKPLEAKPGTHFEYSTGSSNLLAHALQIKLGGAGRAPLLNFLERELYTPLGARQLTPEFDTAGNWLAGHSLYAGAEDLARIGLLLLHDGHVKDRRILPPGWVAASIKPALAKDPGYGSALALDLLDLKGCFGHLGVGNQRLIVCPSRDLVVAWFSSPFQFAQKTSDDSADTALQSLVRAFPERP